MGSVTGSAQIINGYGVKLGLGIANQTWKHNVYDGNMDWNNNTGISARVFADFLNYSLFSFEGEIGFSQKGIKYDLPITTAENPDGTGMHYYINNRLSYFSAALMGKIKYEIGLFTPYLLLGPQFNYLAGKDVDSGFDGVYDKFDRSILGYTAGVGSVIKIQSIKFLVEYRFEQDFNSNYGLSSIDIKNYSHSFLIGLQF